MLGFYQPTRFSAQNALVLIAVFAALKVAIALVFPPTIDEAYAIAVSRAWSLSYFDHPPLGFTIARIMAWATGSEAIWIIRLPYILMGSISAWIIYKITIRLYDDAAAFWALGWFLIAPFFFISAGHFVVPDGPLNLALLAAFWCLLPILLYDRDGTHWGPWLGFGLFLAIALMTKYQAVLFGVAVLISLLLSPFGRAQLKTAPPWAAAVIALAGLLPMVVWNAQNDFISFSFQTARASSEGISLQATNFAITMLGQALYLLPGTFIIALMMAARHVRGAVTTAENMLGWIALILFGVFAMIAAISTKSLPHWPMPGFLFAFPLVGAWCATNVERFSRTLPRALNIIAVAIPALALLVGLQANYSVLTRGFTSQKTALEVDWRTGPTKPIKAQLLALDPEQTVYTRNWARAGKIALALGPDYTVVPVIDPRHFQFSNSERRDGIYVDFVTPTNQQTQIDAIDRILDYAALKSSGELRVTDISTGSIIKYQLVQVPVTLDTAAQD